MLSHLHPDSHRSVALVSKRFYVLATTPHIWRLAFLRYFPGHAALEAKFIKDAHDLWSEPSSDLVRSETRYFGRLTPLATWRSEYLFRTRLIRSLVRGKPSTSSGSIGTSARSNQVGKKSSAVLTYNSKLPWLVTAIDAAFDNGKKPPRAVQGAGTLGAATMSDPTTGKIERWGLQDAYCALQLEEVMPHLARYGVGSGPAATDNAMDVSQLYGIVSGEGFPGGRAYYRGLNENIGRYLGPDSESAEAKPDIPKIPIITEAISSLWIAKSSAAPATTQSMCGIMTGSTLGVVTAYSLGSDPSGPRFASGEITARWVLSPGVPIIALKIDDKYSVKRRLASRVWAVALNALGEVYYLTQVPKPMPPQSPGVDSTTNAWYAGRSVFWHLVEATRRTAKVDDTNFNAAQGAYSPRSACNAMKLSQEQLEAEAREITEFMRFQPLHFNRLCDGWDMRRRIEVDFANDDAAGAGESIFVIDCGYIRAAGIQRFTRCAATRVPQTEETAKPVQALPPSLFGDVGPKSTPDPQSPRSPPPTPASPRGQFESPHDWLTEALELKGCGNATISASALDCSTHSLMTLSEDPLHAANESALNAPDGERPAREIPGRRARFFAIGTTGGHIVAWNARERRKQDTVPAVRTIQTESAQVTCLAATSLYLVHGGNDGLVQAWDPLASISEPIRTLNARSNGRVPRHMMTMNPTLHAENYSAVGAICLDPDPTVLRGVVSFGAFMRYWSYSSKGHATRRKRRTRHSDAQGRGASRRHGGAVTGYIAEEEAELRRENEHRAKEQSRLKKRFGVGALGDLTEQEALDYAQLLSQEAYAADEIRRASDSAPDNSMDTASSVGDSVTDAVTPEASLIGRSPTLRAVTTDEEDEYEDQIQQAIRMSLAEGINDLGQSPRGQTPGDFDFAIKYSTKSSKKRKGSRSTPSSASKAAVNGVKQTPSSPSPSRLTTEEEDLAIALSLSMQEQQSIPSHTYNEADVDFPELDTEGVGKGKGPRRW